MVISQSSEFPLTRENVILLRSGYENLVSIIPQVRMLIEHFCLILSLTRNIPRTHLLSLCHPAVVAASSKMSSHCLVTTPTVAEDASLNAGTPTLLPSPTARPGSCLIKTLLKSVIHGEPCSLTACRPRSPRTIAPTAFLTVKVLSTKQQSQQLRLGGVTLATSQSHPFVILQGIYRCLQGLAIQFLKNILLMTPQTIWVMLPIRPLLGEFFCVPLCFNSSRTSCRSFYPSERAKSQEMLTKLPMNLKTNQYDAWEEDIAMVKVYFAKDSATEFKRSSKRCL